MSASVNNLSLIINRQDSSGTNVENRMVGAISYSGAAGEFDIRQAPDTNQHTLDLPTTTIYQIYIKNTHSSATLTIVGTVTGGSSQTICKLPPGAIFAYWTATAANGFTDLKYTSDTSGSTFEMFLGG
jgi:hypothetical protein